MLNCYLFLGTPFDTPCGISNAGSVTDLKKPENHTPNSGVETPDETQLYALEGTPGCFSRTDSVENLDEHIEKGQKEAAEGPSEKGMLNKSIVYVCIESLLETCSCLPKNILFLRVDKGGLISESFFTLGPICQNKRCQINILSIFSLGG